MNNRFLVAALAGFTLASGAATAAVSQSSQKFLTDVILGDASEIELRQLAQENAGSTGVRDFGKTRRRRMMARPARSRRSSSPFSRSTFRLQRASRSSDSGRSAGKMA